MFSLKYAVKMLSVSTIMGMAALGAGSAFIIVYEHITGRIFDPTPPAK
jgi:hypothetical protein